MLNQHKTIRDNIAKYNKVNQIVDYLIPFVGNKRVVKIADIGSGPFVTIGNYYKDSLITIYPSDRQDFTDFYKKYKIAKNRILNLIEYQNMEKLTYPDYYFDIVHSANALDHTKDAYQAVKEMIRVCKLGGWVYIDCHLDQMDTGHKHFWNVKEDGTFENKTHRFSLKEMGFGIKHYDNGGERRYNHIVATLQK